MREEWRVIQEAPNYSASNLGRIRNDLTERVLVPGVRGKGYLGVTLIADDGRRLNRYLHRETAKLFVPGYSPELEVNHIDTNKNHNSAVNLEWVTHKKNQEHASQTGRMRNSGRAKTPVRIIETGEVFESQNACARAIDGRSGSITAVLMGRSSHHLGYTFEYV